MSNTLAKVSFNKGEVYQEYVSFLETVFEKMQTHYYKPIKRERFELFLEQFRSKIYQQLDVKSKSVDYIRWRSAALMIEKLKDSEDVFSGFYPPKPAKEYEGDALAKTIEVEERIDLGIRLERTPKGYVVDFLEPRSDAYEKGLRQSDLVKKIDGQNVAELSDEEVSLLLRPVVGTMATIVYFSPQQKKTFHIEVEPEEFFKQMVFPLETKVPGIYGLRIERFNRKTSEDVFRYLQFFQNQGMILGLIIDLRGNPGGPPLAARELSSFFLPGGEDFAYFKFNESRPKAVLDIPEIPKKYKYDGPIAILVNEKSGSASELFSGVLQRRGRAVLIGSSTAGQVMLKSMYHFDDESMLVLVTARGHHPDGKVFSFDGLKPNRPVAEYSEKDPLDIAQKYFIYLHQKNAAGNMSL